MPVSHRPRKPRQTKGRAQPISFLNLLRCGGHVFVELNYPHFTGVSVDVRPLFVLRDAWDKRRTLSFIGKASRDSCARVHEPSVHTFPDLSAFRGMNGFTMWRADRIFPNGITACETNFIATEYGSFRAVRALNLSAPLTSRVREKKGDRANRLDPSLTAAVAVAWAETSTHFANIWERKIV
jgi:hypothetical protein